MKMNSVQLKYYVPFKALAGQDAQLAVKESLINIEGTAIDASVNTNKWQVPPEDLDFFVQSLQGSQLRIDHAESALAVIGRVPEAKRIDQEAWFRAEIGDAAIIQKVLRGYLTHVSVQVDSDDVKCSKCGEQTRKEGLLVHLCPGAWEIVHKPRVRELSIVASPAYKNTEFKPVGFAAAMNQSQRKAVRVQTGDAYNDMVQKVLELMNRLDDVQQMDKETLQMRLDNLKKQVGKQRIAELQEKLSKLAEDEEYLEAQKTHEDSDTEFIPASVKELNRVYKALNLTPPPHLARQLETLFKEYQLVDFKGYFEDPRKMERLRALSLG